jgi:fimbrial isopeptide formation D2 family protein
VLEHASFGTLTTPEGTTATLTGQVLTWTIDELSDVLTLVYTVTVNPDTYGETLTNSVSGNGDIPPLDCTVDEPCSTDHPVSPAWDLTKVADPVSGTAVEPGDTITYTLTATPLGGTVQNLVVTDDLSGVLKHTSLDFAGITAPTGTTVTLSSQVLTWTIDELSTKLTLSYTVTVDSDTYGETLTNSVSGNGDIPPLDCAEDEPCSTENPVSPAWDLTKVADPETGTAVNPGDTITYTLTATPRGGTVHNLIVTDDLSGVLEHASLDFAGITAPTGTTVT